MHVQVFVDQTKNEFEMKMVGELIYFLGLHVEQLENGIFISHSKYAKNWVKKFGLEATKHMKTPMSTNLTLTKDDSGSGVDPSLYRSMIGTLLYLIAGRPIICFSVGACARYQTSPKESRCSSVKCITCFINENINDGI